MKLTTHIQEDPLDPHHPELGLWCWVQLSLQKPYCIKYSLINMNFTYYLHIHILLLLTLLTITVLPKSDLQFLDT